MPAISVIIPLYNAGKYIGECLDSVLAQTFQDFEVIVVDDCSTDNSVAVVENYVPKFNGRLRLARMKKNSGSGAEPRNLGLTLSRGKYIFFIDSDDTVTTTAFEELHSVAEEFNADVVECERFYGVPEKFWYDAEFRKQLKPSSYKFGSFVDKPTLVTDNLVERVKKIYQRDFIWNVWAQLIRRDFIFENRLKFVGMISEDLVFTICELCAAKKYVVIPNVVNYYRVREDSIIHQNLVKPDTKIDKHLHCWITMIKSGVSYLDEFLSAHEFFSERPDLKYMLFKLFMNDTLRYVAGIYRKIPAYALDGILRKEFGNGDNLALLTFLFSELNVWRLQMIEAQKRIIELENEIESLKDSR